MAKRETYPLWEQFLWVPIYGRLESQMVDSSSWKGSSGHPHASPWSLLDMGGGVLAMSGREHFLLLPGTCPHHSSLSQKHPSRDLRSKEELGLCIQAQDCDSDSSPTSYKTMLCLFQPRAKRNVLRVRVDP